MTEHLHPIPHSLATTLAAVDPLQAAALVLLLLAAAALTLTVRALIRDGGPGAWRSLLGIPPRNGRGLTADQLQDLMRKADEMAEGIAADLDARAERLEALIQEADSRISDLQRRARESSGDRFSARTNSPRATSGGPARAARSDDDDASERGVVEEDLMTREIYKLADTGLPPVEIARRLSQHTGKVELILALRQP